MTATRNLLVELFVEELPPKALRMLGSVFAENVFNGLERRQLVVRDSPFHSYATPRRLAVRIDDVLGQSADRIQSEKLMPVSVGLTADGQPTKALEKKLGSLGLDRSVLPSLERRNEGKAEVLYISRTLKGALLAEAL